MDISGWDETQVQAWMEQDRMARVKDIEATYYDAKAIKPGVFNRGKWEAAARNLTQLVLLDVEARATHAADVVASAIKEGRTKENARRLIAERGEGFIPFTVHGLISDVTTGEFAKHDWTGTGVDSNDQAMRLAQCAEYLEAVTVAYLDDPPPEWERVRGGAVDDEFIPALNDAKGRVLRKAFSTPAGLDFRPAEGDTTLR